MGAIDPYPDWMVESHKEAIRELKTGRVTPQYLKENTIVNKGQKILNDLVENGFAENLDNTDLYELVDDPTNSESWFHLICQECENRVEITLPLMKVDSNIGTTDHIECVDCNKITKHDFVGVSPP